MQPDETVDLCVIGGGVNGTGIARDAAGRGLSVTLAEQGDLAEGTSSRSGKLVHGGLRYLEYYEFRLVREALIEREALLRAAPHIIWPMRFVLPHSAIERPAWLVRAGLFLYDHLGGRKLLPGTRSLALSTAPEGEVVKPEYKRGFEYSDCWVDDARLTVLNALGAHEKGATILTRTRCTGAQRQDGLWHIELTDVRSARTTTLRARALINAAGPWVNRVIDSISDVQSQRNVRMVKGSHLIMKKFWQGEHAFLIQNDDKRVIFVNPYEGDYALIGTTDIACEGDPAVVIIDEAEINYLLRVMNRYFINQFSRRDVLSTFSGVRPLYDDNSDNPSAVTRDYVFDVNASAGNAALLTVYGGKITTYRKLAEHALDKLSTHLPASGQRWTASEPLPGGDIANADFEHWLAQLPARYPLLPPELLRHYARLYGTRCHVLLDGVSTVDHLGENFSPQFHEVEARYLVDHEWAQSVEDILDRRTKHGLHMSTAEQTAFGEWFARQYPQWTSTIT